jgi:hypothetical protein
MLNSGWLGCNCLWLGSLARLRSGCLCVRIGLSDLGRSSLTRLANTGLGWMDCARFVLGRLGLARAN